MKLTQIEYTLAVAKTLSFSAAAEKNYVSRQAVSRSVHELEQELNLELFRTDANNRLYLTTAGEKMMPELQAVLDQVGRIRRKADLYSHKKRPVRIAYSDTTATFILQDVIGMLYAEKEAEPGLIDCVQMESNTRLSAGDLKDYDIVLMITHDCAFEGYECERFYTGNAVLSIPYSSPLYKKERITAGDLKGITVTHPVARCPELEQLARENGFRLLPDSNFYSTCYHCIEEGFCVLDIPYPQGADHTFVQREIPGLHFDWSIIMLWKENDPNPNSRLVRDKIRKRVKSGRIKQDK